MGAAAVLYVKDLTQMSAFYATCFGLTAVESVDGELCVLESADWELSLVAVPAGVAATIVVADPPVRRAETPIKLAFDVASIDATCAVLTAAGGTIDHSRTPWQFRGHRHLDALDPEGNVIQLRDRPPASP